MLEPRLTGIARPARDKLVGPGCNRKLRVTHVSISETRNSHAMPMILSTPYLTSMPSNKTPDDLAYSHIARDEDAPAGV